MPVFTTNIPGPLKIGDRIEIGGKIKQNARKMSVNLCTQQGEEPNDVVLHFDVRFHKDNIISLSRKNGVWIGSGSFDTNYNMFVPGTMFNIVFEIKSMDVIKIYCQGKFHSNFLPKISLSMARYVVAWADVAKVTHCFFHIPSLNMGVSEKILNQISHDTKSLHTERPMPLDNRTNKKYHKQIPEDEIKKTKLLHQKLPADASCGVPPQASRKQRINTCQKSSDSESVASNTDSAE